jgi:hypothetical protein
LDNYIGVLANLPVVARIVFLVVQIPEERDYAIVENTTRVGHGMADWMSSVAHDRDRADVLFRGGAIAYIDGFMSQLAYQGE